MLERGLLFLSLNILFWGLVFLMEEHDLQSGRLPKRTQRSKSFWYTNDWRVFLWGELVGCSFLSFVVGYAYRPSHAPLVLVAAFVGFALTLLIHTFFVSTRRTPGSHYPKPGVISWNGTVHLGYYFWQLSFGTYLLLLALVGMLQDELLGLAVLGCLIYLASLVFDIERGTLAPRKK